MFVGFLGVVFLLFGLADLGAGYLGIDIWEQIPIELPVSVTDYSAYIMIVLGVFFLILAGGRKSPPRI